MALDGENAAVTEGEVSSTSPDTAVPDENAAGSSDAGNERTEADAPISLMDAVDAGLATRDEADGETPQDARSDDDADGQAPSEDEDKNLPFHDHPRFKELISEKNEWKGKVETLTREVEIHRTKSAEFDKISNFMSQNDLSPQETSEALVIAALMKSNPEQAYKALEPRLRSLLGSIGAILPADLQTKVDDGYITIEDARELARSRTALASSEEQRKRDEQRRAEAAERAAQEQQRRLAEAGKQAIVNLEKEFKTSDPDYAKKAPLVSNALAALLAQRGRPETVEQAVEWTREAYASVTQELKAFVPSRPPLRTTPSGKSSQHLNLDPTRAKSLMEAVDIGLRNQGLAG